MYSSLYNQFYTNLTQHVGIPSFSSTKSEQEARSPGRGKLCQINDVK